MELFKKLVGQGLEIAIHEDGVHLLVGSMQGLTSHQRETIQSNRERLLEELRSQPPANQYTRAMDLPLPLLQEDQYFIDGTLAFRPANSTHQILTNYFQVWIQAASTEFLEQKKENAGRRAANAWLREQQH